MKNGLIQIFLDAGCTVNGAGCGACIGRHGGILAAGRARLYHHEPQFYRAHGQPGSRNLSGQPGRGCGARRSKAKSPTRALYLEETSWEKPGNLEKT